MKRSLIPVSIALAGVIAVAGLAQAQEPSESPSPDTAQLCVEVLGQPPVEGWNPTSLREALVDGSAVLTEAGPCPTATADPTDLPVVSPTPTTEPAEPTPTSASAVEGTSLEAFLAHSTPGLSHMADYFTTIANFDTSIGSMADLKRPFEGIRDTSSNQLDWMDARNPQPCYASLWESMHQMWTYLLNGSRLAVRGLSDPTGIDAADLITRGSDAIGRGTDLITRMNDEGAIESARAACASDPGASDPNSTSGISG